MSAISPDLLPTLTGQTDAHLVADPESACLLHREVLEPFARLRAAARAAGFDLAVASSFRSFERQCLIWNDKAGGRRPVLDDDGRPINLDALSDWEKVQAILRWSALPGASRHHWGTDLDVFDRSALPSDSSGPALTQAECEAGGPFFRFHQWLDQHLPQTDFFRPYEVDRGGIGREPWHISFRPVSALYQQALSVGSLRTVIEASGIALAATVLDHLDEIHQRFVALP